MPMTSPLGEWIQDNPETALEITTTMDGHTIFAPSVLEEMPDDLAEEFVRTHESDGTLMDNEGNLVDELEGVGGLLVLRRFAEALEVDDQVRSYIGSGFQAQAYQSAIKEELEAN